MSAVLICDDITQMRDSLTTSLEAQGHEVVLVEGETMLELVDNAVRLADENPGFILVLDFNLRHGPADGEIWGGIWLYVAMRDRGALEHCRRVIVASRYIPDDVRSLRSAVKPTDAFVARVFVELAAIPDEDIFKLDVANAFQELAKRASEIFLEQEPPACACCGRPFE